MNDQLGPIKVITGDELTPRAITINSVSFWRSEEGVLFMRGYDEALHRTVDLIASTVRFVA